MNKISTAVVMMTTVLFVSCGGNDTPEVDKSIMPATDSNKVLPVQASTEGTVLPQPANGQVPPMVTTSVPAADMQANAKTITAGEAAKTMPAAGLNPAHGQPGHRCDIAVGAPLNSAPATATQPQATISNATQPTTISAPAMPVTPASAAPADPNAKLNPAHGQPGHDCAIPVGAPLKKS